MSGRGRYAAEPEDLPDAVEELEDSDVEVADAESEDEEEDSELMDNRPTDEIEEEGRAALAAEQQEEVLSGATSDQGDAASDSPSIETGEEGAEQAAAVLGSQDRREEDELFRIRLGTVKHDTLLRFYLEFLLLCNLHGRAWKQALLAKPCTEKERLLVMSARETERRLLDMRQEINISTWVSAHPALAKHLNQLPYFTQQRSHGHPGYEQRCAVCYRARECGIKLFLFHGHPVQHSAYIYDSTSGITAPRKGERATSKARQADIFGQQQFGGSAEDTGSSSDDGSGLGDDWSRKDWKKALPCQVYGSRRARRQRRHDRKMLQGAALLQARTEGWAWTGFSPPDMRDSSDMRDVDCASSEGGEGEVNDSDDALSSDDAPIAQRRWHKTPATPAAAAAAGGGLSSSDDDAPIAQHRWHSTPKAAAAAAAGGARHGRRSSDRRKQRHLQESDQEGEGGSEEAATPPPAAAAAGGGEGRSSRYQTRRQQPADTRSPAQKQALQKLASKSASKASKQLQFDTSNSSEQQQGSKQQQRKLLRHSAAAAAAAVTSTVAVAGLLDDIVLTDATPKKQQRRRQQHVISYDDSDAAGTNSDNDGAAAAGCRAPTRRAAGASHPSPAAAAAAGLDDGADAPVVFSPGKRSRQRHRTVLLDEEADSDADKGAAGRQSDSAAAAAAGGGLGTLGSPAKRLRQTQLPFAPVSQQQQQQGRQQRHGRQQQAQQQQQGQQQQGDDDDEVIDLCDSQTSAQPQQQQGDNAADANHAEAEGSDKEPAAYRKRGFLVGGGVCSMRIRLHHLLQHWPYKATLLLRSAYDLLQLRHPTWTEQRLVEKAQEEVFEMLYEDAFEGVKDALKHLVQVKGSTPDTQEEQQHWAQLIQLVEAAEKALDQDGQSTFKRS